MEDEATRLRLVCVAAETFAELGWRDAAVVQVCARSGVDASDFYRLYDGVDDFFVSMYAARADELVASTIAALNEVILSVREGSLVDPRDATRAVARVFAAGALDRTWWILTTEYSLRAVRHPEVATSYLATRQEMRKGLGHAVRHALEMAGLDELVDADRLVQLATAVHRGALADHFLEPGQVTLEDLDQLAWLALIDALT